MCLVAWPPVQERRLEAKRKFPRTGKGEKQMASDPTAVTKLYEQIPLEAMQQVSDSYLSWYVDRVTRQLDEVMAGLRAELRENDAKEASYCPTPHEQEAIERLKRSGVTGIDLLDRMVEQGEDWLSVTMRRLDHFERTGLAPKDYSTWCEHALSGAYDWIDHERLGAAAAVTSGTSAPRPTSSAPAAPSAAGSGSTVPEWLGSRNASGRSEEASTSPVPSVAPRWNDSNYYGQGNTGPRPAVAPGQSQPDDDSKGRNIFRIFTN